MVQKGEASGELDWNNIRSGGTTALKCPLYLSFSFAHREVCEVQAINSYSLAHGNPPTLLPLHCW